MQRIKPAQQIYQRLQQLQLCNKPSLDACLQQQQQQLCHSPQGSSPHGNIKN
jgi:hypothetical protein